MPALQVVKGPNVGECYELTENSSVIGRYPFCEVVLPTHTVSREHARIVRVDDKFYLEDINSLNGTFLNGERVRRRTPLKNKDRIRLYEILLLFYEGEPEPYPRQGEDVELAEKDGGEDSEGPKPLAVVYALEVRPPTSMSNQQREQLRLAMEGLGKLGPAAGVDEVLTQILNSLMEAFAQTERGHILLADGPGGALAPKAVRNRQDENAESLTLGPINQELAQRIVTRGEAALHCLGLGGESGESVLDSSVHSSICAPLVGPSRVPLGVIHLDAVGTEQLFTKEDLELLVRIGFIAGQAVEMASLME